MPDVAMTNLVPIQEMAPGAVTAIRSGVISALVAMAARELNMPASQLVVRDVRPLADLQLYSTITTDSTSERWGYAATGTTIGYTAINSNTKTMSDQRFVALFGVRDVHGFAVSGSATLPPLTGLAMAQPTVSLIKVNVGGGDKALWDVSCMYAYQEARAAFTQGAVVIPQNATYVISYYRRGNLQVGVPSAPVTDEISWLQLIGVVVEPRGKVISP